MPWYIALYTSFINIFAFKDGIEIALCSLAIYYFSLWLKQDRQKNLLFSFYGYCAVFLGCYYTDLQTMTLLLFITCPFVILLFVILHQELLQKNFISLAAITTAHHEQENDWLETVIRACLIAINSNKTIYGVIENRDSLANMLTSTIPLYAQVQKNVLTMTFESASYDQEKLVWLSAQGKLLGINTYWNRGLSDIVVVNNATMLPIWQQEALFFTHKTDALVFSINPISRTFTLIVQGKVIENVSAAHALTTIKKFLNATASLKGDSPYEIQSKKHSQEQRNA